MSLENSLQCIVGIQTFRVDCLSRFQFKNQTTLTGVAQAIVDKVVRKHTDVYVSGAVAELRSRDDITLLVRNFNFPHGKSQYI